MMNQNFYKQLTDKSIAGEALSQEEARDVLVSKDVELLTLLDAAFTVRKKFRGKEVDIHILNNAQNGYCPEDCNYCPQSKPSEAKIEEYPLKSDQEILAEAESAHKRGAHRYCMVFAGRGPSRKRVEHVAQLIRSIKSQYPIEVCVSAGLVDQEGAKILKEAGLDRLNHNLNTSKQHYPKVCSTHTFDDRVNTLQAARKAGLQVCSGVIVGMGEEPSDVIDVAQTLRSMQAASIPVNFLIPIEGNILDKKALLSPEYCLRVLCLFRFLNPQSDIRAAAGREMHLRGMEVMSLYPANSLFLDGYLNVKGEERRSTLQMIKDAGFTIRSEYPLDDLIQKETVQSSTPQRDGATKSLLKDIQDLRPQLQ